MKQHRMRTVSITTLILSSIPFFASLSAQAGSYTITYSGGRFVGSGARSIPTGPPTPQTIPYSGASGGGVYGFTISAPYPFASNYDFSGAITTTFQWKPNPNLPVDPPPTAIVIKQWCRAYAVVSNSNESFSASSGMSAPVVVADPSSRSETSTVFTVKYNPGTSFTLPSVSPSASGTGPLASHWQGGVQYIASYDTRALTISSSLDGTYYKGTYDTNHGSDRYQHVRDVVTGAMVADTAVQKDSNAAAGTPWDASADMTAQTINFTSSSVNYDWSSSGIGGVFVNNGLFSGNQDSHEITFSLWPGIATDQFPTTSIVTASATDSDGAKLSNTYNVNWHTPWEETSYVGRVATGKKIEKTLCSDVFPGGMLSWPEEHDEFEYSALLELAGSLLELTADEDTMGLWEIVVKTAGLTEAYKKFDDAGNTQGVTSGSDQWTVAQEDNNETTYGSGQNINGDPTITGASDGWLCCKLSWCEVSKWREDKFLGDDYDATGYLSPNNPMTVHTIDLVDEEPYYEQYKWPNGTPYTPGQGK